MDQSRLSSYVKDIPLTPFGMNNKANSSSAESKKPTCNINSGTKLSRNQHNEFLKPKPVNISSVGDKENFQTPDFKMIKAVSDSPEKVSTTNSGTKLFTDQHEFLKPKPVNISSVGNKENFKTPDPKMIKAVSDYPKKGSFKDLVKNVKANRLYLEDESIFSHVSNGKFTEFTKPNAILNRRVNNNDRKLESPKYPSQLFYSCKQLNETNYSTSSKLPDAAVGFHQFVDVLKFKDNFEQAKLKKHGQEMNIIEFNESIVAGNIYPYAKEKHISKNASLDDNSRINNSPKLLSANHNEVNVSVGEEKLFANVTVRKKNTIIKNNDVKSFSGSQMNMIQLDKTIFANNLVESNLDQNSFKNNNVEQNASKNNFGTKTFNEKDENLIIPSVEHDKNLIKDHDRITTEKIFYKNIENFPDENIVVDQKVNNKIIATTYDSHELNYNRFPIYVADNKLEGNCPKVSKRLENWLETSPFMNASFGTSFLDSVNSEVQNLYSSSENNQVEKLGSNKNEIAAKKSLKTLFDQNRNENRDTQETDSSLANSSEITQEENNDSLISLDLTELEFYDSKNYHKINLEDKDDEKICHKEYDECNRYDEIFEKDVKKLEKVANNDGCNEENRTANSELKEEKLPIERMEGNITIRRKNRGIRQENFNTCNPYDLNKNNNELLLELMPQNNELPNFVAERFSPEVSLKTPDLLINTHSYNTRSSKKKLLEKIHLSSNIYSNSSSPVLKSQNNTPLLKAQNSHCGLQPQNSTFENKDGINEIYLERVMQKIQLPVCGQLNFTDDDKSFIGFEAFAPFQATVSETKKFSETTHPEQLSEKDNDVLYSENQNCSKKSPTGFQLKVAGTPRRDESNKEQKLDSNNFAADYRDQLEASLLSDTDDRILECKRINITVKTNPINNKYKSIKESDSSSSEKKVLSERSFKKVCKILNPELSQCENFNSPKLKLTPKVNLIHTNCSDVTSLNRKENSTGQLNLQLSYSDQCEKSEEECELGVLDKDSAKYVNVDLEMPQKNLLKNFTAEPLLLHTDAYKKRKSAEFKETARKSNSSINSVKNCETGKNYSPNLFSSNECTPNLNENFNNIFLSSNSVPKLSKLPCADVKNLNNKAFLTDTSPDDPSLDDHNLSDYLSQFKQKNMRDIFYEKRNSHLENNFVVSDEHYSFLNTPENEELISHENRDNFLSNPENSVETKNRNDKIILSNCNSKKYFEELPKTAGLSRISKPKLIFSQYESPSINVVKDKKNSSTTKISKTSSKKKIRSPNFKPDSKNNLKPKKYSGKKQNNNLGCVDDIVKKKSPCPISDTKNKQRCLLSEFQQMFNENFQKNIDFHQRSTNDEEKVNMGITKKLENFKASFLVTESTEETIAPPNTPKNFDKNKKYKPKLLKLKSSPLKSFYSSSSSSLEIELLSADKKKSQKHFENYERIKNISPKSISPISVKSAISPTLLKTPTMKSKLNPNVKCKTDLGSKYLNCDYYSSSSDSEPNWIKKAKSKNLSANTVRRRPKSKVTPFEKFKPLTPLFPLKKLSFLSSLTRDAPKHRLHPDAVEFITHFKKNKDALITKLYDFYNLHVFENKLLAKIKITWNPRLRKTAGFCYFQMSKSNERGARIELSNKVVDSACRLRDVLIHEMCHAAAWLIDGYKDGHGSPWKIWASTAMKVFPELPLIKRCHAYNIETKYTYKCTQCENSFGRHSKSLDTEKYCCGICGGRYEIIINYKRGKKSSHSVQKTQSFTPQVSQAETQPLTPQPKNLLNPICEPRTNLCTPRAPNAFALFVKDNYGSVRKDSNLAHGQVMKILSEDFAQMKVKKANAIL